MNLTGAELGAKYDVVVACGLITVQSKTVLGRYSSVKSKNSAPKKAEFQNNCVIDSFPYMQKHLMFFH